MKYSYLYVVRLVNLLTVTTMCFISCLILGRPRVFVVGGGLLLRLEMNNYKFEKYKYVWLLVNMCGVDKFLFLLTSENHLHWSQTLRVRAAQYLNPRTVYSLSLSLSLSVVMAVCFRHFFSSTDFV